ncbi:hypothetical protein CANTEDRAFT_107875 [Yamadazyma tenuis ATCC 10573]|uniref:BHLH domain-containing protein n=2 Tax=Candida tenuis TaxID=2315449 RepID=G3BB86_CANTC|nr:uncharacterized protein CANTEDRAFT_107875 [Yamadazyma tenuis ATCC 10573]EGV61516.1 hypothetical protein CANTEDRAFT_107875 [Yamadazyma tenuis ATCC 10573]
MSAFDYDGYNNDFFDFDNTDSLLTSLSGPASNDSNSNNIQSLSPDSMSGDDWATNKWYANQPTNNFSSNNSSHNSTNDYSSDPSYNNTNANIIAQTVNPNLGEFDNSYQQTLFDDFNNNYSDAMHSSGSSQNDSSGLTPLSQQYSSAQTSPENIAKAESDDDFPKKGARTQGNGERKTSGVKINAKSNGGRVKRDKASHNVIEKKYRTNINTKILMLRDAVPSLRIASGVPGVSVADLEGLTPAAKLNKASVLTKATEYIQHLEKKNEMLRQQNSHLQRLIQQANLNANSLQVAPVPNRIQPTARPQPMSQMSSSNEYTDNSVYNNSQNYSIPPQENKPNKYFLGGMAAVMGTSLLGGPDSDFRGLSAIPFMPMSFAHPPGAVAQLWYLSKLLFFLGCLASWVLPNLFSLDLSSASKEKKVSGSLVKSWILVSLGLQLPSVIDEGKKASIIQKLLGHAQYEWTTLIGDYIYLSSCESTFETCFLNLLIGSLLLQKMPALTKVLELGMNLRFSLLLNLDYKGTDKSLVGLNKLVKDLDGICLFKNESMITRLSNLRDHLPINAGIERGTSLLKFVEVYKQNGDNLYKLVLSWRVLQIVDELNTLYLENSLIEDDEEQFCQNNKLFKDVNLIGELLEAGSTDVELSSYLTLFKASLLPKENTQKLMTSIKSKVNGALDQFNLSLNGLELTDDEEISDDEDEESERQGSETNQPTEVNRFKDQTKLINSLGVVSEEELIILTCGLIQTYYSHGKRAEAAQFLKHLKFKSDKVPLSVLAFTSIYQVVSLLVKEETISQEPDNGVILDQAVRVARLWLNDNDVMTKELRAKIADVIVAKGKLLNGCDDQVSDQ